MEEKRIARWWNDERALTLVLVNLASILERADEALLPAVYREVGIALNASPSALGSLTLMRSLTQSLCAPLAGYLAIRYNRASIIAAGAVLWAVATFFVGISSTFAQVAVSRAVNGVGLAVVVPAITSLVADATNDSNRGMAFGWLQLAGNIGSILGGLCSVLLASTTVFGVPGWRISFHIVALLSVVIAVILQVFGVDPHYSSRREGEDKSFWEDLKDLFVDTKQVLRVPTFQILVAQGVAGSFPWASLAFASMWLELIGFTHAQTAALMGAFVVGTSVGALFGGWLGDFMAARFPNTGRIILSQISSGFGIPMGALLLLVLPMNASTALIHGVTLFFMGFGISWNASATNGPIFAEVVPEESRTNVYALDRAFETLLAAFAPPVVGLLAENVYGYTAPAKGDNVVAVDRNNGSALAKALYTAIGFPFVLCCLMYSVLYWTYPRDRDSILASKKEFYMENRIKLEVLTSEGKFVEEDEKQEVEWMKQPDDSSETLRMLPKELER